MKKNGKKWRAEHSKKQPSTKEQLLQSEWNLKRTPRAKEDIVALRDMANTVLRELPEKEQQIRVQHEDNLRRYREAMAKESEKPGTSLHHLNDCLEKLGVYNEPTIEYSPPLPIPTLYTTSVTPTEPNLSDDLEQYGRTMIVYLSNLFGIFRNGTDGVFDLIAHDYDWEQNGLLPLAERYLEILCWITEGTTWISRKNTRLLISIIKVKTISVM